MTQPYAGLIPSFCVLLIRCVIGVVLLGTLLAGLFAPLAHTDAPRTTHAQDEEEAAEDTLPLPVASFGEHPRLLITNDYVNDTLRARANANADTWQAFLAYVSSGEVDEDASWTAGTSLRSLALAWQVTGEIQYADRAKAVMVTLANRIESHPALAEFAGFDNQLMEDTAALAVGYDWLHGTFSDADRDAITTTLWRAAQRMLDPNADAEGVIWVGGQLMAFGNYEPRWLWALTATALALWGEHEGAPALMDTCREILTETITPALDLQEGGAWAEGPVYGFIANWPKVQTALVWWTAAGENYFDDTAWWYNRLAYDMFLYHPAQTTAYREEWGDPMPSYPSIIGDSERYHAIYVMGRAQDALLTTVFAGYEYADWMTWYLRQAASGQMAAWFASEEFLWRDPDRLGLPPSTTTWIAPYNGHVFMRNNWLNEGNELDTSATYVSFNAGDRLAYHQFYDQGNFTIFHNGADLLVRSGVYSGDGTSDHDANYYVRTIAGNTLLICDLAENFDGIRPNGDRDIWLNDCGQRSMDPASRTAINVDYLVENWQAYDTGSITRFGEIGEVTYMRADITGAYNSTVYTTPDNRAKVSAVIRELVYWRPGVVLVSDRVVLTYPSYTPLAVFHFQNEPAPTGLFYGSLVGNSAIYMQNFKPGSIVSAVQGFQVAGQEVNTAWGEPISNNFERDPYGYFRLEIAPGQPNPDHWFLTGFTVQDAAQPAPPEGLLVIGDTVRGAAMGSVQVVFDLMPEDGRDVTSTLFQVGPDVEYTLVTGLQPGAAYQVIGDAGYQQELIADDAGLILISGAPPGGVQVTVQ